MSFLPSPNAPVRLDFPDGSWAEFASSEVRDWLMAAGVRSLEAAMAIGENVYCRHSFKAVCRAALPYGDEIRRVFIKRQWRPQRWAPRLTDMIRRVAWTPIPQREWDGLWRLRRLGLDAARPLALYRGGRWTCRSAVITAEAPGQSLKQWLIAGRVRELSDDDRAGLAQSIGAILHRLVATGWRWRGVDAKHLYPEFLASGDWRIWLIDCEGVETALGRADNLRDRRKLLRSIRKWSPQTQFVAAVAAACLR